jgi:hypothetical protein
MPIIMFSAYSALIQMYPTFLSKSLVYYSCVTSVTEHSSSSLKWQNNIFRHFNVSAENLPYINLENPGGWL